MFISSKDYLPNNDGQNNTRFDNSDPENITLRSLLMQKQEYIPCSIEVVISNSPSGNRTTIEVIKHEMGHAYYVIGNIQLYYEWLKTNDLLNNLSSIINIKLIDCFSVYPL